MVYGHGLLKFCLANHGVGWLSASHCSLLIAPFPKHAAVLSAWADLSGTEALAYWEQRCHSTEACQKSFPLSDKKNKSTRAGVKAFRVYFRVAASKDKVHTTCLILSLFSASAGLGSRRSPMSNHQGITAWTETKISLAFTDEPYMSPWSWRWQHNQNLQGTSQISNSYSRRQLMDNIPSSLSKTHAGKIT